MPVLLIGAGVLLIGLGLSYLRQWYVFWSAGSTATAVNFDLYMGICANVLGAAFIGIGVVAWRRF